MLRDTTNTPVRRMFSSLGFPSPRDVLVTVTQCSSPAANDVAYLTHWFLHINDILYLLLFLEKKRNWWFYFFIFLRQKFLIIWLTLHLSSILICLWWWNIAIKAQLGWIWSELLTVVIFELIYCEVKIDKKHLKKRFELSRPVAGQTLDKPQYGELWS